MRTVSPMEAAVTIVVTRLLLDEQKKQEAQAVGEAYRFPGIPKNSSLERRTEMTENMTKMAKALVIDHYTRLEQLKQANVSGGLQSALQWLKQAPGKGVEGLTRLNQAQPWLLPAAGGLAGAGVMAPGAIQDIQEGDVANALARLGLGAGVGTGVGFLGRSALGNSMLGRHLKGQFGSMGVQPEALVD